MRQLIAQLEACLFVATKPVSMRDLARLVDTSESEVHQAVLELVQLRNVSTSGVHVLVLDSQVQLVTNPDCHESVSRLAKEENPPELTQPSLEALTIIAYRGPITKAEIEAIRGVNCSVIIRNLLMRGLIDERNDAVKLQPVYTLSPDTLRFLGLHSLEELPDYATLHANAHIDKLLAGIMSPADQPAL